MLATATFVLQTSVADDPVRHRSLASALAVATKASAHPERIAPRIVSFDVKGTQTIAASDDARRNIPAIVATAGRSSQPRPEAPIDQRAEVVSLPPAGPELAAAVVETAPPLSAPAVVPDEPAATTIETAAPFRSESSPSPSIVSSPSRAPSSEAAVAMTETTAVRTALNRYQRAFSDLDAAAATVGARRDPEHELGVRDQIERARSHLVAMDPRKAEALLLHDVLGHELAEIAVMTGTSIAAAQSRLVRARRELVERMRSEGEHRE